MEKLGCHNNCSTASFVSEYVTKKAEEDLSGVKGIYLNDGVVLSITKTSRIIQDFLMELILVCVNFKYEECRL